MRVVGLKHLQVGFYDNTSLKPGIRLFEALSKMLRDKATSVVGLKFDIVPTFGYFNEKSIVYTDHKTGEIRSKSAHDYSCEALFLNEVSKLHGCNTVVYKYLE